MTVSSTTNRKTFAGNGVTTSFATSPVVFFDTSDLVLTVVTDSTGASETLMENTDYTVTGGAGTTGTVSLAGGSSPYGAPAAGTTLVIRRVLPLTQDDDFLNNDINDAEVLEDRLDRLTMIDQQIDEETGRSLKVPSSEGEQTDIVVAGKAGYYLRRNVAGTAFELAVGDANTSTFTQSGTGAVERSVTAKLGESVSVKDFGAVCDGVTDDAAEFAAAVSSLAVSGGIVQIPQGAMYAASGLSVPAPVNIKGQGPAHHAFYDAGDEAGTTILITGAASGHCLTLGGNQGAQGNMSVEDISIYSAGSAAVASVVRLAGVLHPYMKNVEIDKLDNTNGIGLHLTKDTDGNLTLYGDFINLKIGGIDTALQITNDQNTNSFHGGSIGGRVRAFLIEGPITDPLGTLFNGTSFEGTYSTAMEHEWVAAGEHVYGVARNTAGYYVVKLGKLTGGNSTTFNGCYFEIGGTPATYNDGVHGVASLYPVIEVGTGAKNTQFINCSWNCYLLDRGLRTRADGFQAIPDYWTKQPPVSVRRSSVATAIGATSFTAIPFASALAEDTNSFYWDSGNTRLEVLIDGFYEINVQVVTENWAAAQAWGYLRITAGGQIFQGPNQPPDAGGNLIGFTCHAALYMQTGDSIKVEAFMGEAVDVVADVTYNRLTVKKL